MKCKDKIALITGASRGIGRAIAIEMAKEGAIICIVYKSHDADADKVLKELKELRGESIKIKGDIRIPDHTERIVTTTYERFRRIDILVNNAAIVKDYCFPGMEWREWQDVIDTNLTATFTMCKFVSKHMILQKSGKIINLSSVVAQKGGRGQINYIASKGGIESFTRALAIELAPKNITVNAIAPGVIETDMSKDIITKNREKILSKILLKRFGRAEEVARLAVYLASSDADYITGEVININGGFGMVC
ncbi:MAG: 3-oxoacyl-ACP reductase family protein [bacterium]